MRRTGSSLAWSAVLLLALIVAGCNSAWVSSGILYQEQDKWAKAEQMFKTGLWFNEEDADAHYQLAYTLAYRAENEHLVNGEVDSARIKIQQAHYHYLRAAELEPDVYDFNPEAEDEVDQRPSENGIASLYAQLFNEGVRLMGEERTDEARLYFELAGLADPRGVRGFDAALLVAKLDYNKSQGDEAALQEVLKQLNALEVDDSWEDAVNKKADLVETKAAVYTALGQDAMAARLYEELLASSPNDLVLLQRVAQNKREAGDLEAAKELYDRAIDVAASDPELSDDIRFSVAAQAALAFREAEDYETTIAMADRALEFATTNTQRSQALRFKARAHFELERYQDAIDTLEPVVRDGGYDPTNVEAWQIYYLSLARVGGRDQDALKARERFLELQGGGR